MSLELIIRTEAEADIADDFDWYETRVRGLGSEFLLVLDAIFNSIIRNHLMYPVVYRNVHRALTRRFPYAVLYSRRKQGCCSFCISRQAKSQNLD